VDKSILLSTHCTSAGLSRPPAVLPSSLACASSALSTRDVLPGLAVLDQLLGSPYPPALAPSSLLVPPSLSLLEDEDEDASVEKDIMLGESSSRDRRGW
jgi:hypothetical protein